MGRVHHSSEPRQQVSGERFYSRAHYSIGEITGDHDGKTEPGTNHFGKLAADSSIMCITMILFVFN
jgi:hypothetical protein